jgi:uncharacterized membrane protein
MGNNLKNLKPHIIFWNIVAILVQIVIAFFCLDAALLINFVVSLFLLGSALSGTVSNKYFFTYFSITGFFFGIGTLLILGSKLFYEKVLTHILRYVNLKIDKLFGHDK